MILLAIGADDIIRLVFLLIFFIGPVIMQVFKGGEKKPQPRKPRRPQQPPQPQRQQSRQQRPAAPGSPAEALDAEIEQFLKRASGRQQAQQAEVVEVVEAQVLDDVYQGETIDEHVRRHISVDDVTEHSADFGRSVTEEVQELDQHVKVVFEHQVGSLESSAASRAETRARAAATKETSADRIRRMLSNPDSVKDAVILQEILRRPEF